MKNIFLIKQFTALFLGFRLLPVATAVGYCLYWFTRIVKCLKMDNELTANCRQKMDKKFITHFLWNINFGSICLRFLYKDSVAPLGNRGRKCEQDRLFEFYIFGNKHHFLCAIFNVIFVIFSKLTI
mgnify:CR=1 FL=1